MNAVLVVDDDRTQQLIISKILKRIGLNVIIASNGVEALEQVYNNSPSLIILDLNIPGMNGTEVCEQLKADEKTQKLPVVVYSGQEREFDNYWGKSKCADAYLSKVCHPQALIDTVLKLLCFSACCCVG
ncbi:MAG TPA: two-component system response regulator [Cyanobacteria bacterium UBA8803]|nr:two-component system response regulator [Cyanobacteria bacterium UBA9273]HBL62692.1 two-component system response regulator [Cyanobacteria bacterium UBA8803]